MAVKIDKEFVKKNQFWIGLGTFLLLWLVAVIVVVASGGESEKKKAYDAALTGVKGKGATAKTKGHEEPWVEYANKFEGLKKKAWEQGWKLQEGMYDWPEGMTPLQFADDEVGADVADKYRNDAYPAQYAKMEKDGIAAPVDLAGGFKRLIPQQAWHDKDRNPNNLPPTREEMWLAQEDFWVKRDLLYVLRMAMDGAARCKEIAPPVVRGGPGAEALEAGEIAHYKVRNTNWEIKLVIKKPGKNRTYAVSEKSTIKNVHPSRRAQPLAIRAGNRGLYFRLWQEGFVPVYVEVVGSLLAHNATVDFQSATDLTNYDPKKPLYVDQIFEWENCPIRRLETLDVAHQSHRTTTTALKARPDLMKLDPAPKDDEDKSKSSGNANKGGQQLGGAGSTPPVAGSSGGKGGDKQASEGDALTRNNKINRDRYLHVSEQCRHLPIAMRLVVDPAHVHDILGAMINSRLRIRIEQVQLHRATDVIRPSDGKDGSVATSGNAPIMGGGYSGTMSYPGGGGMGSKMGSGSGPPKMGSGSGPPKMGSGSGPPKMGSGSGPPPNMGSGMGRPPFNPGSGTGSGTGTTSPKGGEAAAPATPDPAPLVELTIYGTACLYERYPPRPKATPPAAQPAKK